VTPLVVAGMLSVPLVVAAETSADLPSALIAYGVAAPFALLCYVQLKRAQEREDKFEKRMADLQDAAVARERELAGALASRLYDASLLYREGTAKLSEGLQRTEGPEIQRLVEQMQTLLARMEQR
jgi:hypothetical protein